MFNNVQLVPVTDVNVNQVVRFNYGPSDEPNADCVRGGIVDGMTASVLRIRDEVQRGPGSFRQFRRASIRNLRVVT